MKFTELKKTNDRLVTEISTEHMGQRAAGAAKLKSQVGEKAFGELVRFAKTATQDAFGNALRRFLGDKYNQDFHGARVGTYYKALKAM